MLCRSTELFTLLNSRQQEHSESTDLHQGKASLDPASVSGARTPDGFQKVNVAFLVPGYIYDKFSFRSDQFFQRYEPNLVKCRISQC